MAVSLSASRPQRNRSRLLRAVPAIPPRRAAVPVRAAPIPGSSQNRGSRSSFARTTPPSRCASVSRAPWWCFSFHSPPAPSRLPSPTSRRRRLRMSVWKKSSACLPAPKLLSHVSRPLSKHSSWMTMSLSANGCLTKTTPEPDCPAAPTSSSKRCIKTAERCMHAFGIFCPTAITP